jgi:hypothetical protein
MRERLDCSPEPSSVRTARRFVVEKLQEWRCEELVDRAALVTSELATNAVVHTGMPYSVLVERQGDGVRVEVADAIREMPPHPAAIRQVGTADRLGNGHRVDANRLFSGLGLVDAVATRWGSDALPSGGKVVWFEIAGGGRDRVLDLRDRSADAERGRVAALFGRRRRASH